MAWYFRRGNQAFGPIGDEELRLLVRRGAVNKRTPLQQEGSSEWQPAEALIPRVFDTPPPADGPSTPVRYEEVFPGDRDGAESVNFSSGGFGEFDAFLSGMGENVDLSFSSDGDSKPSGFSTPAPQRPVAGQPTAARHPATPVRPTPTRLQPDEPVREEDSKAVCFGCGRLLKTVELTAHGGTLICSACRQRLAEHKASPPAPAREPGFVEARLTEWIVEGLATLLGLALFLGFLKGNARWMLGAAPAAPAGAMLAACLCGGLDHSHGRRMLAVTAFLWAGALMLYLPQSMMAPVVFVAGRGVFIWALLVHDIRKRAFLSAFAVMALVSVLGGVLVVGKIATPHLVLSLVLIAADMVAVALAWGAWQGGATLSLAAFGSLLYLWDAVAVVNLFQKGVWVPALLTAGLAGLCVLAVLSIDQETGRPEGAGRWPLRRAPLPLTAVDSVAFSLTTIAVLAFAAVVLVKGPPETLVYAHCVLLAALVLAGTNARLTHPNHVKWLLFAWALAILTARIVPVGKGNLYAFTPIALSKTYPVLHIGQLVQVLAGVALAWFARFHLDRVLLDSVRQWHRLLLIFLAGLGAFALREALELPLAAAYPKLLARSAYGGVFDLIFAGAGLLLGLVVIQFQERD